MWDVLQSPLRQCAVVTEWALTFVSELLSFPGADPASLRTHSHLAGPPGLPPARDAPLGNHHICLCLAHEWGSLCLSHTSHVTVRRNTSMTSHMGNKLVSIKSSIGFILSKVLKHKKQYFYKPKSKVVKEETCAYKGE